VYHADPPPTVVPAHSNTTQLLFLALAALLCVGAFAILTPSGAHLLHFDAKAHLVVSRRVLDNLTPGWSQLGAIWLPLPHILNALPAQNDFLYHSGLFAGGLGLLSFVAGVIALSVAAARVTGGPWAGIMAATVPLANPGWLYLQATPLTEPLFLGLVGGLVHFLVRWRALSDPRDLRWASVCAALACLVRYEAWPIAAVSIVLAFDARTPAATRRPLLVRYAIWALLAPVLFYSLHSLYVSGRVLHTIDGHNLTDTGGDPWRAALRLGAGLVAAFGLPLVCAAGLALVVLAVRRDPAVLLVLALCTPAVVTFVAYLAGHPVKARYALLLAPALGLALAAATRGRKAALAVAILLAASQGLALPRPLPVLVEATRDEWAVQARHAGLVTLRREYRGGRILAALSASSPLVFDLRLPVREIVHEGNEDLWKEALQHPAAVAAWVIIYPWDPLGELTRTRPGFPEGFVAVRRLGSATLYARTPAATPR
jgi:hypothetical protein